MKFVCFALVCGVGATSASCDTPEDDVLSALQYAVKVKEHDMPMDGGATPGVECTTCKGQDHNLEMSAPDSNLDGPWKCHNYQEDENNEWCAKTSVHEGFDMKFTGGDATLAPGCGRCWCCTLNGAVPGPPAPAAVVPPVFSGVVEHSDWQCHDFATEGGNNEWCSGSPMNGPFQIRFTAGDDLLAPGCGDCWCCKRDTREKCPNWVGIATCGEQELQPFADGTMSSKCVGMGELSCTQEHLDNRCGVDQACCANEDGPCVENDYNFACLKQSMTKPSPVPAPPHTMTKPSPAPVPAPPVGVTVVSVAPAWMGARPLCGNSALMKLTEGTTACQGSCTGKKCEDWVRPCKEEKFDWCTKWGLGLCCSDEDGDCTNDGYQFSCLEK